MIQLGIALSLPWLIRQASSWLNTKPDGKRKADAPYTRLDDIVRWTLLAMIVYQLVLAFAWTPPNVLATMKVGVAAPSFKLRNAVWEYTEKRYGQKEAKQVLGEAEIDTPLPGPLERLRALYTPLKDQGKRLLYLKYGETAFLGCGWCEEGQDYLLNIFPSIALDYLLMFAVVTLATEARRKRTWWTWAIVGIVCIGLFVDMLQFNSADDEFIQRAAQNPDDASAWASAHATADRLRRIGFVVLCVLILMRDGSLERTENEIARSIVDNNQMVLRHLNAYRLQKSSVLNDDNLRRAYVEFYRGRAIEADLVLGNAEYESVKKQAIQKHSMEKLMEDQALLVDRWVLDGLQCLLVFLLRFLTTFLYLYRMVSSAIDEDKELLDYEAKVKGPIASSSLTDDIVVDEGDESVPGNF